MPSAPPPFGESMKMPTTPPVVAAAGAPSSGTKDCPYYIGECDEQGEMNPTADAEMWDKENPPAYDPEIGCVGPVPDPVPDNHDGLILTAMTRVLYQAGADEILYGYCRDITIDSAGRICDISGETRVTIDEPVMCDDTVDPPEACNDNVCDPDPEMLLTVTGASGTVVWCGETWNLPAESGDERSVCPTFYRQRNETGFTCGSVPCTNTTSNYAYPSWGAGHEWRYTGQLTLRREYHVFYAKQLMNYYRQQLGGTGFGNYEGINLAVVGKADQRNPIRWVGGLPARPVPPDIPPSTYYYGLGIMTGLPYPYYSNYLIPTQYFNSHTDAGITYTWAKGAGWP